MVACWSEEITALQRVPDLEEDEKRSKDNRQALDKAHDPVTPMPLHDPAGQKKRKSRDAVAPQQPVHDRCSARVATHDGRIPREPSRDKQPDCANDVAQLRDANPVRHDGRAESRSAKAPVSMPLSSAKVRPSARAATAAEAVAPTPRRTPSRVSPSCCRSHAAAPANTAPSTPAITANDRLRSKAVTRPYATIRASEGTECRRAANQAAVESGSSRPRKSRQRLPAAIAPGTRAANVR